MPTENQAETFIRLLMEEFEAYRRINSSGVYRLFQGPTKKRVPLYRSELTLSTDVSEPLDCFQVMSATQRQNGGGQYDLR
jgi:hypothetical protein